MSKAVSRYIDTGETIYSQMQEILVTCPRCEACAVITPCPLEPPHPIGYFTPRRVICRACGFVREWEGKSLGFTCYAGPMQDSYFGLPLWLQTACCGHVLWAYNRHHLALIEKYVQANLRELSGNPKLGWHIHSLTSKLPEWMIVAKHRKAVLAAIAKLRRPR